jgi:hypothetical protein
MEGERLFLAKANWSRRKCLRFGVARLLAAAFYFAKDHP